MQQRPKRRRLFAILLQQHRGSFEPRLIRLSRRDVRLLRRGDVTSRHDHPLDAAGNIGACRLERRHASLRRENKKAASDAGGYEDSSNDETVRVRLHPRQDSTRGKDC